MKTLRSNHYGTTRPTRISDCAIEHCEMLRITILVSDNLFSIMMMITKSPKMIVSLVICVLVLLTQTASADAIDPHNIYKSRCAQCHGTDARAFVDDNLKRRGDDLYWHGSSRSVAVTLSRGHGHLSVGQIAVLVQHFSDMEMTGALYQEKCRICHSPAIDFARAFLIMKDGKVVGRYSDHDTETFLQSHGRLDAKQVGIIVSMFNRQLSIQN